MSLSRSRSTWPWVPALLILAIAGQSSLADAPTTTALDVMRSGRPPDLYKVTYGADDDRCRAIAAELNKPSEYDGSYWESLTHTSYEVGRQLLTKETHQYRNLLAEFTRA